MTTRPFFPPITTGTIASRGFVWSAGMYRPVGVPNPNALPLSDLLDPQNPYDKGTEPGSDAYAPHSPFTMLRTRALQDHSYLLSLKGDATVPVVPRKFVAPSLRDGDILLSKDSNVGECAIVDGHRWSNFMFSAGIVRLHPAIDRWYLFAFLKHPLFKAQLVAKAARGATITHAKKLWLDCLIPFPRQPDAKEVERYVSALTQAIVHKERAIRERSDLIQDQIQRELHRGQSNRPFNFELPSFSDIHCLGRLDACIYDREYKSKIWLINNYRHGSVTPTEDGFSVTPGPSLELKIIKTRIDSDTPRPGYYALILPMNLSEYGTINVIQYLGTAKRLPLLEKGDVLFGEAGFQKGRSVVLLERIDKCTTNAHGLIARRADGDLRRSIFFRCIFNWYRTMRLIDLMAVGGSGGHFSPQYFDYLRIPRFPEAVRERIVDLYHRETPPPSECLSLKNFVAWHQRWNAGLGIWELDREMRRLKAELGRVQEQIILDAPATLPL
jgi:hypothetical protein